MTRAIYRQAIDSSEPFRAPHNVTFGWQESRKAFSVWFAAGDDVTDTYQVVGTGHPFETGTLVASVVLPDGFHVFHLVRLGSTI